MIGLMILALYGAPATHRVVIDGVRYRVTVRGKEVMVARKSLVVSYTVEERDRQRRAVTEATGCTVVDELPSADARTRGVLNCGRDGSQRP